MNIIFSFLKGLFNNILNVYLQMLLTKRFAEADSKRRGVLKVYVLKVKTKCLKNV